MSGEIVRRVPVWRPWLRISHALLALGTLFQLASGWLLENVNMNAEAWIDWHVIVGQAMVFALILRVGLLFTEGAASWRALIPGSTWRAGTIAMLKFYLSMARLPLPAWFAHNPFWLPIYPLMLLLIAFTLLTGFLRGSPWLLAGASMSVVHVVLASVLAWVVVAHVVATVLHDLKGGRADISGIINGYCYFTTPQSSTDMPTPSVDVRLTPSPRRPKA